MQCNTIPWSIQDHAIVLQYHLRQDLLIILVTRVTQDHFHLFHSICNCIVTRVNHDQSHRQMLRHNFRFSKTGQQGNFSAFIASVSPSLARRGHCWCRRISARKMGWGWGGGWVGIATDSFVHLPAQEALIISCPYIFQKWNCREETLDFFVWNN